ncbi:MAG: 16S rRNA (guanine(527)-N(7))-methyltransferase RsmG [Oscillospiraceae bacterium]|nr:16S rRNA (guanine(527)-N(7))-methyltransferase RsmG [Oscillospiraceae bacterium]
MLPGYEKSKECFEKYGLDLSADVYEKLDTYAQMLCETNKSVNLTAITEPYDILLKHFIDSIIMVKYIDFKDNMRVIDVGTGAGFPLLPIKIYKPSVCITLIDGLNKRVNFLKEVCSKLNIEAECLHERAELLAKKEMYREQYDIAVARAVSPMPVLAEYCLPFVKVNGCLCSLKGPSENIDLASNAISLLGAEITSQTEYTVNDEKRKIIIVKKISHTSSKYPRNSNKIISKPL